MMNSTVLRMGLVTIISLQLLGCRNSGDQLRDDAEIQATAEAEIERRVASQMEQTLTQDQKMYQGLAGTYEGVYREVTPSMAFTINLIPTVWPYRGTRARTRAEVARDLDRLEFNAEFRMYSQLVTFGCVFSGLHPDPKSGRLDLMSDSCAYSIHLFPAEAGVAPSAPPLQVGQYFAQQFYDGTIKKAPAVYFEAFSTRTGTSFIQVLQRTSRAKVKAF